MWNQIDFSVIFDGGPVMIPLAGVSIFLWYCILKELLLIRKERADSRRYFSGLLDQVRRGNREEALAILEHQPGLLPRILISGVEQIGKDRESAQNALRESVSREFPLIGRSVSMIGALASVAPLLGLLGTISGMIATFQVISWFGTGEPEFMARGISEALITTQTGLIVGIPGILFYMYLSTQVRGLRKQVERRLEHLLGCFEPEESECSS